MPEDHRAEAGAQDYVGPATSGQKSSSMMSAFGLDLNGLQRIASGWRDGCNGHCDKRSGRPSCADPLESIPAPSIFPRPALCAGTGFPRLKSSVWDSISYSAPPARGRSIRWTKRSRNRRP